MVVKREHYLCLRWVNYSLQFSSLGPGLYGVARVPLREIRKIIEITHTFVSANSVRDPVYIIPIFGIARCVFMKWPFRELQLYIIIGFEIIGLNLLKCHIHSVSTH